MKCWGWNYYGQVGDGTNVTKYTPTTLSTLTSVVSQIGAGDDHTCVLLTTGGVTCWGYNYHGQVGDGTNVNTNSPTTLSTLTSGVTQIAVGGGHTCALLDTGGVKCWGSNGSGQLGNGGVLNKNTPTFSNLTSGVTQIAAGEGHTCALLSTGAVQCWGWNNYGQVGDGTNVNKYTPTTLSTLTSGATQITARSFHTCALLDTGGVTCWGRNFNGQLGDGTYVNRNTPTALSTLTSGVAQITAGRDHNCALLSTGGVKCWGRNDTGQLGDGTNTGRVTPVDVVIGN